MRESKISFFLLYCTLSILLISCHSLPKATSASNATVLYKKTSSFQRFSNASFSVQDAQRWTAFVKGDSVTLSCIDGSLTGVIIMHELNSAEHIIGINFKNANEAGMTLSVNANGEIEGNVISIASDAGYTIEKHGNKYVFVAKSKSEIVEE